MSLFRAIPIDIHGALEVIAAPLLMVAPFVLGFGHVAGAMSILLGVLLVGLGSSVFTDTEPQREKLPLSSHAGLDYAIVLATIVVGIAAGIAGDFVATVFLVGFGSAHLALTAATRFSRPLGA
jgi:hypothetical protein